MLQAGEAMEPHIQDFLGLDGRQVIKVVVADTVIIADTIRPAGVMVTGPFQHFQHIAGLPALGKQLLFCHLTAGGGFDQLDHRVNVGQRHRQTFQHMATLPGLAQIIHGAAGNHFATMTYKALNYALEIQ